ncbi:MAG: hypothetical protein R6V33_08215, partial [Pelovirga sp.]
NSAKNNDFVAACRLNQHPLIPAMPLYCSSLLMISRVLSIVSPGWRLILDLILYPFYYYNLSFSSAGVFHGFSAGTLWPGPKDLLRPSVVIQHHPSQGDLHESVSRF